MNFLIVCIFINFFTLDILYAYSLLSFNEFWSDFPHSTGKFLSSSQKENNIDKLILQLEESDLSGNLKKSLDFYSDNKVKISSISNSDPNFRIYKKFSSFFLKTLLPVGYPESVPLEYSKYQTYNIIQDFCSYLRGIMSTQAILEGFGVGRSDITALQATVQWIIRDGASMLGSLLFTSLFSANFGNNIKSWRLFADFINNFGITLDMIAPLFPSNFLLIISFASICKALCGVAAGASGAAIYEYLGSKKGNIAEILSKNSAQHTVLSLIGLGISVPFAKVVNSSKKRIFVVYVFLTCVHMVTNYLAMKVLAFKTINETRLKLLIDYYLNSDSVIKYLRSVIQLYKESSCSISKLKSHQKFTLDEEIITKDRSLDKLNSVYIARNDKIIYPILPNFLKQIIASSSHSSSSYTVSLSSNPFKLLHKKDISSILISVKAYKDYPYLIFSDESDKSIHIILKSHISDNQVVAAFLNAFLIKYLLENNVNFKDHISSVYEISNVISHELQFGKSFNSTLSYFEWNLDRLLLLPNGLKYLTIRDGHP